MQLSTFDLISRFPDAESARLYLEELRWHGTVRCPWCESDDIYHLKRIGFHRCRGCSETFTVRTNSVFARSKIPLHKWLLAMYLMVTARNGISSIELGKSLGITQKSAWYMLGRLREACGGDDEQLVGTIEVDETYIGGKEKFKHRKKRKKLGRGGIGKQAVLGMRQRGGPVRAKLVNATNRKTLCRLIEKNIAMGSIVYTDSAAAYDTLNDIGYYHHPVNHSDGEYVRGRIHTNGIESTWQCLKRSISGTWHHVTPHHLHRYLDECAFRLHEANSETSVSKSIEILAHRCFGKRITCKTMCNADRMKVRETAIPWVVQWAFSCPG